MNKHNIQTTPATFGDQDYQTNTSTEREVYNAEQEPALLSRDILENPFIRKVGGWCCHNNADPIDEDAYVAKAKADIKAFSDKLDSALELL